VWSVCYCPPSQACREAAGGCSAVIILQAACAGGPPNYPKCVPKIPAFGLVDLQCVESTGKPTGSWGIHGSDLGLSRQGKHLRRKGRPCRSRGTISRRLMGLKIPTFRLARVTGSCQSTKCSANGERRTSTRPTTDFNYGLVCFRSGDARGGGRDVLTPTHFLSFSDVSTERATTLLIAEVKSVDAVHANGGPSTTVDGPRLKPRRKAIIPSGVQVQKPHRATRMADPDASNHTGFHHDAAPNSNCPTTTHAATISRTDDFQFLARGKGTASRANPTLRDDQFTEVTTVVQVANVDGSVFVRSPIPLTIVTWHAFGHPAQPVASVHSER